MRHALRAAPAIGILLLAAACGAQRPSPPHLVWDPATLRRLHDGPASYPRMIRLQDGALLCSFESRGASLVIRSEDDGVSWSAPVVAAAREGGVAAAVPSLLQLSDGTVLLAYNPRPPADNQDPLRRFGIHVAASMDGGRSWSERATVFAAGYQWGRGIWEPAMVQLPSGEIQLFAANEWPYAQNDDQEISRFRSRDGGRSWSAPETVGYRAGHRDGMPVPLLLRNGHGLAVAIEDDGLGPGLFKPAILMLPGDGTAPDAPIDGNSSARFLAVRDAVELPDSAYAGAPYLVQLPTGETLLSLQTNAGRGGEWSNSIMAVALGSPNARDFSGISYPFPVPVGRKALWGSLFVKDSVTVTALTTTTAFNPTRQELYVVDGRLRNTPGE